MEEVKTYPWDDSQESCLRGSDEIPGEELVAAANSGNAEAQYGMSRYFANDAEQRGAWLKKAAEGGHIRAQYE